MKEFRSKIWVIFFFCLISMGQAYPYAMALAQNNHAECSCNRAGRECQHGCDLKKRRNSSKKDPSQKRGVKCHEEKESAPSVVQHHSTKKMAQASSPERPVDFEDQWVSPSCSKSHRQSVLSFQGDPFIPWGLNSATLPQIMFLQENKPSLVQGMILSCEEPPPKEDSPPSET